MKAAELPAAIRKYADIISDVSDERENGDGYWIYLKSGLINDLHDVHMVHEDTLKECAEILKSSIVSCRCSDCESDRKEAEKNAEPQLTEMEQKTLDVFIANLTEEESFSDVAPEDLSSLTGIPIRQLRGVLSSLAQKGIVYIEQRHKDVSIVYLHPSFYYLHPRWGR